MAGPLVDVHCHVFNADDLPVRGFVQRLHLQTPLLGPLLATLIDQLVQGGAPGYAQDRDRLDRLLAGGDADSAVGDLLGPESMLERHGAESADDADRRTDEALAMVVTRDPAFARRLGAALAAEFGDSSEPVATEDWTNPLASVRRATRWARLFGLSRLDIAAEMARTYQSVDLFCPLLVDLGIGLGDVPKTTMGQQVELSERLSRISMLGLLPGGGSARLHPFVGFDPRRQLRALLADAAETPFDVVRSAVLDRGFVGVKVYPPMGWRPLGNSATVDMTEEEARRLDEELRRFYDWCQAEDVPVTAHGNRSNYPDESFAEFAGPSGWGRVLAEFPRLHLNFGHFGGARATEPRTGWPWEMAKLAVRHEHVYADVGNHRIDDRAVAEGYLDLLERIFSDGSTEAMRDRIMYGSDWFMLALAPEHERFPAAYQRLFSDRFGGPATDAFRGGNALRFLGFDDPGNRNAVRLRQRYERYAPHRLPDWLAG